MLCIRMITSCAKICGTLFFFMEFYQHKAQFLELICFQNHITSDIDLRETNILVLM